jgi:hypothetical protein
MTFREGRLIAMTVRRFLRLRLLTAVSVLVVAVAGVVAAVLLGSGSHPTLSSQPSTSRGGGHPAPDTGSATPQPSDSGVAEATPTASPAPQQAQQAAAVQRAASSSQGAAPSETPAGHSIPPPAQSPASPPPPAPPTPTPGRCNVSMSGSCVFPPSAP